MTPDLINGLFELFGDYFLMKNIKSIREHKELKGVHWAPTVYFTAWGIWNLFYYPHLNQWVSFAGGIVIVTVNTIWLAHIWYYYKINRRTN